MAYSSGSQYPDYDGNDYTEPQQQQQSAGNQQEGKRKFSPRVDFYKPRRNFVSNDPKTHGYAMTFDLAAESKYPAVFINSARQKAPQGEKQIFNWEKEAKLICKLDRLDIAKMLMVFDFWTGSAELFHQFTAQNSPKKTTVLKITRAESIEEDWAKKSIQDNKLSKSAVMIKLSQSVEGQQGSSIHTIILQPEEAILLKEFLRWSLWKLFAV